MHVQSADVHSIVWCCHSVAIQIVPFDCAR